MPINVPVQAPGAKSLPAGIKMGNWNSPMMRMKAQHPGYPLRRWTLGGLGDGEVATIDFPMIDPTTGITASQISDIADIQSTLQNINVPLDTSTLQAVAPDIGLPPGYSGPNVIAPSATPPPAPSGYQWASIINNAGQTMAKVLAIAQGGAAVQLPNGMQMVYGSPASAATAGTIGAALQSNSGIGGMSVSTIMLIGAGLLLVMMMSRR